MSWRMPGDAVVRALANAARLEDAGADVLGLLGRGLGFRTGVLWTTAPDETLLRCTATWCADPDAEGLPRASRRLAFAPGDGLVGRVHATGEPAWIADIAEERDMLRRDVAIAARLRCAVLVPIVTAGGRGLGVLELTGDGPRAEQGEVASLLLAGRQLGEFAGRVRAEADLRSAEELQGAIVRAALDCIVVSDHEGRVLDFNPAAEATFGWSRADAVGRLIGELLVPESLRDRHEQAFARYVRERGPSQILDHRLELEAIRADGTAFPVELTVTRLGTIEPPRFAGFIRDLTDRRRAEEELARLFEREHDARLRAEQAERATRRIADALQRSLLPPHLPAIDGVELAATYRAGSEQADVGGDFYDVFALAPDRWGIVIGDVCGKGPEAAAITALARYTVRTAAVREQAPAAVLEVLNDALLRDTAHEAFCTVVYGTLDLSGPSPEICLAVAGHPPPLVLDPSGEVVAPAPAGSLLGVMDRPRLVEHRVVLEPGQLLLLYTDGLIEGRVGSSERFGVEGLTGVLRGLGGLPASTLVGGVEDAIIRSARRAEDDVAVLAVRAAGGPSTTEHAEGMRRDGAGGPELVSLSLPATPESVPTARRAVTRLARRSLDEECCHRVATAVTEAAANVVVHAYRDRDPGTIDVTARLEEQELVVLVEDGGGGISARDDSPGLGLGLPLIQHCADDVEISHRTDGGGSVRMRFRCRPAPDAA